MAEELKSENMTKKFVGKYDLDLDYGIEKIMSMNDEPHHLPNHSQFDPIDGKIESKLKGVLSVKTLIGSMISLLRPEITDRSILTPQQFRLKLQQVIDAMEHESKNNKTCNKEVLDLVVKLLTEEQNKSELLDEYRHMLLLG